MTDYLKLIKRPCYLQFDKNQMTNLQISMTKEILLTNRLGGFCSTTVLGCNIRKYNGLLVVPVPGLDDESHVLLSSLDETVIQHGAEFNLGIHKFQGENYSPKGHKYIVKFEWDKVPVVIYRVGGVILQKEIVFMANDQRVMIRYTLLDAHSATTLRLRQPVAGGVKMCMYHGYPELYMQTSKKSTFKYVPDWYLGFDYPRERERGYSSNEDLFTPGYFEMPIKKGESIVFSAGLSEMKCLAMKRNMEREIETKDSMSGFYNCLVRSAHQFHIEKNNQHYIKAGYPWFKCRARDFFIAMPGLTLYIGEQTKFERYMETASTALRQWMDDGGVDVEVYEVHQPSLSMITDCCIPTDMM